MQYAIIEVGGHQTWIQNGQYVLTNRLSVASGTLVSLNLILLAKKNETLQFGTPYLKTATVQGQVLEHIQGPKIVSYKMKSKKKYRRKHGHRQQLTKLLINEIKI